MSDEFRYELDWPPTGHRPGHHLSRRRGAGMQFREHLPWSRDPDPRRLDLFASVRDPFGELQVRSFRERRSITVRVLADASASMGFATKWQELTAFCAAAARSAYRTGDAFSLHAAAAEDLAELHVPAGRHRGSWAAIAARLSAFTPHGSSIEGLLPIAERLGRTRSLVFVVSDFHVPLPLLAKLLDRLALHAVVPVMIRDTAEFSVPARNGWLAVGDVETGARQLLWLRARYRTRLQESIARHERQLHDVFLAARVRPVLLRSPFEASQVSEYFAGGARSPHATR